ncbi:MAG: GMC family oxidoreductase [Bacteroidetes bacterium]|nr:GMC family oxidoreductase [Bacteroidota bacterium]
MKTIFTDALVIGTGFGGAAPALRLSQAGFKTIILEKGPHIDPNRDFRMTQDPKYVTKYIKSLKGNNLSLNYVEGLGGGSGFYEMLSLRTPSMAFEQKNGNGNRYWPKQINRSVLDPYYEISEKMLCVRQISKKAVPKTGLVFSLLMKRLGYSADRAPFAEKHCIDSGFCVTGCVFGAKQSLHLNYLPQAKSAGTQILCEMDAKVIKPLGNFTTHGELNNLESTPYRYEVTSLSKGEKYRFRTKILILAGGTIGSAVLLLRSKKYLRHLSKHLGKSIAFNGSVKTAGILPSWCPDGDMYTGRSVPGMVSFQFLNSHGVMVIPGKPFPLQTIAAARFSIRNKEEKNGYWGKSNVELMKLFRHRVLILIGIGMGAPKGRISLNCNNEPVLDLNLNDSIRAYYNKTKKLLESILKDSGCQLLNVELVDKLGKPYKDIHFVSSHQLGSCKMADSKRMGVLNFEGEAFDYPGLYVSDGASIPTSLAVNPALTILANAERISAYIVRKYSKNRKVLAVVNNRKNP